MSTNSIYHLSFLLLAEFCGTLKSGLQITEFIPFPFPTLRAFLQHFVDALSYDENPVEYLMNRFPQAGMKPEVGAHWNSAFSFFLLYCLFCCYFWHYKGSCS